MMFLPEKTDSNIVMGFPSFLPSVCLWQVSQYWFPLFPFHTHTSWKNKMSKPKQMKVEMQTVGLICCKTTKKIIWKVMVLTESWFKDTNPPNPTKSQVILVTAQKVP